MSDNLLKALHETQTDDAVEVVVIDLDFFDSLPDDEPDEDDDDDDEIDTECVRCGGELEPHTAMCGTFSMYCYACGIAHM